MVKKLEKHIVGKMVRDSVIDYNMEDITIHFLFSPLHSLPLSHFLLYYPFSSSLSRFSSSTFPIYFSNPFYQWYGLNKSECLVIWELYKEEILNIVNEYKNRI